MSATGDYVSEGGMRDAINIRNILDKKKTQEKGGTGGEKETQNVE